jgi:hypothetical protein
LGGNVKEVFEGVEMKTFDEWFDKHRGPDYTYRDAWDASAAEHQKLLLQYRDMLAAMENLILKVIELHPEIKDKL